jgi:A/G-specific adenine glycosylase
MAQGLLLWHQPLWRQMPWRATRDPYRIWLSEVMLHQTQAETAVPYYERFLTAFPTVEALAAAPLDDVLKLWEGLGYYARARNLHAAARQVVARHGGQVPRDERGLLALPGIGRYTAGEILSIAFGEDYPAVDGNVTRVLCRVFNVAAPPASAPVNRQMWELTGQMLPRGQAGDFNQALMDLGALVCTPRRPQCGACPWRDECEANRLGLQAERPVRGLRRATPHYDIAVGVIWRGEHLLIARRPPQGLLGGLWEFPGGKIEPGETPAQALAREASEELGIQVGEARPFLTVRHAYTHFRVTLHVLQARHQSGQPECRACTDWRWESVENLRQYAFPAANHRIIAALEEQAAPGPV